VTEDVSSEEYYEFLCDFYVSDHRLVIITNSSNFLLTESGYLSQERCHVKIFDVSDPERPTLISTLTQDGIFQNAALVGSALYLLSNADVYRFGEESDYLPHYIDNGEDQSIAIENISLSAPLHTAAYTIVSQIDIAAAQRAGICAMTGATAQSVIDESGLYLSRTVYLDEPGEPFSEAPYSVSAHKAYTATELKKIDSMLQLSASQCLVGSVVGAFAVEQDKVQLLTASDVTQYQIFTDTKYGWENRLEISHEKAYAYTVFDAQLQLQSQEFSATQAEDADKYLQFSQAHTVYPGGEQSLPRIAISLTEDAEAPNALAAGESGLCSFAADLGMDEYPTLYLRTVTPAGDSFASSAPYAACEYDGSAVYAAYAPDGKTAVICHGGSVKLYTVGAEIREIGALPLPVWGNTAFLFSGTTLYLASMDAVYLINTQTAALISEQSFGVG
jgi:hypothetical protein